MTRSSRLVAGLGLNGALVVGEVVAAALARSTVLLADAGHNLADVAALALSLAAVRWAMRPRSDTRSFGNHRATILAALANAALLAVVTFAVAALGVERVLHPVAVHGAVVAAVGGAALVVNGLAALLLVDRTRDLNMRGAFVHMAGDVLGSLGVVVAGVIVALAGQSAQLADPAASLAVCLLILVQAVGILRESSDVLLESTPTDVDLDRLRETVTAVPGVGEVHDLHVWSISSDYRALSAHLVLTGHPTLEQAQETGARVRDEVTRRFGIAHTTFELECERCVDEVVDPCAVDEHHAEPRAGVAHGIDWARTRRDPE
jgi:cobalt-zinc-cadmium efflux system protein